jgi:molybdate transport system ATP-binding protein
MSSSLILDISLPLDRFPLALQWETSERSLGLFGPSGAGKTSVLESIAGLRAGARGRIVVNGRDWLDSRRGLCRPPEDRGVGYVPQDALLFPHRSVLGNLLMGRGRAERAGPRRLSPQRVMEVLELAGFAGSDVARLSGGEKQRVALARALCSGPELLLLDEPLAALDAALRRRVLSYLLRIKEEFGIPTLYVSHDATDLRMLTTEVTAIVAGRAVARGRPEDLFVDPAVLPMARSGGFENILRGRVTGTSGGTATVELAPGVSVTVAAPGPLDGRDVVVGVRAEDLILAAGSPTGLSAQNVLPCEVVDFPDPLLVRVALGRARLTLAAAITPRARQQLGLRPGLPVHLVCKAHALRILAAIGTTGG